jgi:DNA-binding CsgD family transcriptional regulator
MTLNNPAFTTLASRPSLNSAAQRRTLLQTDIVSTARMRAVEEVGAAMAHQLSEPLTALLLYLHRINQQGKLSRGGDDTRGSIQETVDKALHETQRVCDILERLGHTVQVPVDRDAAVAHGREVIETWLHGKDARGNGYQSSDLPASVQHLLTGREQEVLTLIIGGSSNKEGGHQLGIAIRTFEVHRAHIMEKLGARNAADLVRRALSEAT